MLKLLIFTFLLSLNTFALIEAPSIIYVGNGMNSLGAYNNEYYQFFSDSSGNNSININDYTFVKGNTYTFTKLSSNYHPFVIADSKSGSSWHLASQTSNINYEFVNTTAPAINPNESVTFTIPSNYLGELGYYCQIIYHSRMQNSLNISDPQPVDFFEVTNFKLTQNTINEDYRLSGYFTAPKSLTIPAGTSFAPGETKIFDSNSFTAGNNSELGFIGDVVSSNRLIITEYLTVESNGNVIGERLNALDALNNDHFISTSSTNDLGLFFVEQSITDPLPDIPQGNIIVEIVEITDQLTHPIGLIDPNDGSGRKFVFQQTGEIKTLDVDNNISSVDVLDISGELVDLFPVIPYDERGLLGVILHPSFTNNGILYYFASVPTNSVADFTFSENVNIDHHSVLVEVTFADSNGSSFFGDGDTYTQKEILRLEQPVAESFPIIGSNHNSGSMSFDTNGYLMISIGDAGDRDDTGNGHGLIGNSQDPSNIWGSIIRIDLNGTNSINTKYGIPPDNPFVNDPDKLNEIYAYGFRNPWTFSLDPASGIIYSADSGQDLVQEVNIIEKGKNYGWRTKEGSFLFDPQTGLIGSINNFTNINNYVDPLVEYDHDQGYANVIGGHVYRGESIPSLIGSYVCGDYGAIFGNSGSLFYIDASSNTLNRIQIGVDNRALTTDVRGFSFDSDGELYFVGNGPSSASLFKIVPYARAQLAFEQTSVNVTVDGNGQFLKLIESSNLDNLPNGNTNIVSESGEVLTFPIEEAGFFRAVAE